MMKRAVVLAGCVILAGCVPGGRRAAPGPAPAPAPAAAPAPQPAATADEAAQLPAPAPAWETRPVNADARTVPSQRYVVRKGDTLRGIADRTGSASEAIARANGMTPPFTVRIGQRLSIPGGRYHLVRPGQTGIAIARAYALPWARIVAANALVEPYILRAGQRVLIPVDAARPASAAERAAAFTLDVDTILTGGEPAVAANQPPVRPVASPARVLPATAAVVAPAALPGRFVWPVDGRIVRRFGHGATGERSDGVKIAVPLGTPVRAVADGTVAYVGDGIAALGGLVIVKHGGGWTSVYGHASQLSVRRGQAVTKGQEIALSGETGYADRPELHFELRRGRTPVDPTTQLPRR
ncbi:MAG: M23 family metallopeptidase [Sphingomonas adhaesiva]|uniref:M23 family metallopeptidase n=1 Tax=Sphingomonas adhaesiva TaxID=28212 RepID=UPI002FF5A516